MHQLCAPLLPTQFEVFINPLTFTAFRCVAYYRRSGREVLTVVLHLKKKVECIDKVQSNSPTPNTFKFVLQILELLH
jgi:hypothetical protein